MKVTISDISYQYVKRKKKTLNNIHMEINTGVFGLLGENGAGKTTLLKLIATLLPLQNGTIAYDSYKWGEDEESIRKKIGFLPQKMEFFSYLTSYEFLYYICLNKKMVESEIKTQIEYWLEKFNLLDKKNEKIASLSGGMKQRIGIIQALIGDPEIIILDEPTVGLDPIERLRFKNIISEISRNKLIIISTHIISDISVLCNEIGLMKSGELLFCGSTEQLIQEVNGKIALKYIAFDEEIPNELLDKIISVNRIDNQLELRYISDNSTDHFCTPNLEDAFFYKTRL